MLALAILYVATRLGALHAKIEACGDPVTCGALPEARGRLEQLATPLTMAGVGLPIFAGVIFGVPLVARGVERGTASLPWAMSSSRHGWFLRTPRRRGSTVPSSAQRSRPTDRDRRSPDPGPPVRRSTGHGAPCGGGDVQPPPRGLFERPPPATRRRAPEHPAQPVHERPHDLRSRPPGGSRSDRADPEAPAVSAHAARPPAMRLPHQARRSRPRSRIGPLWSIGAWGTALAGIRSVARVLLGRANLAA